MNITIISSRPSGWDASLRAPYVKRYASGNNVKKLRFWILIAALSVGILTVAFYAIALKYSHSPVGVSPEVTAICQNFWNVFNNLVLIATLLVVAVYTYETYHLRALLSKATFCPIGQY